MTTRHLRLWLRNELIKYKKEIKSLGVTFDQKLTFKAHIEDIITRCKKRLNLLKALRNLLKAYSNQALIRIRMFTLRSH